MQTTYNEFPDIALEGQIADISPRTILHRAGEEEIPFGYAVIGGTADTQVKLPTKTGDKIVGVVTHTHAREVEAATKLDMLNVMIRGAVYVRPETAVSAGGAVYVRHTAGDPGEDPGRFRADGDTDKADLLAGARWRTSAGAGKLAILEINLP